MPGRWLTHTHTCTHVHTHARTHTALSEGADKEGMTAAEHVKVDEEEEGAGRGMEEQEQAAVLCQAFVYLSACYTQDQLFTVAHFESVQ